MKHVNCEQKGGCRWGFQGTVLNYGKNLALGHEMCFPEKQNTTFLLEKQSQIQIIRFFYHCSVIKIRVSHSQLI